MGRGQGSGGNGRGLALLWTVGSGRILIVVNGWLMESTSPRRASRAAEENGSVPRKNWEGSTEVSRTKGKENDKGVGGGGGGGGGRRETGPIPDVRGGRARTQPPGFLRPKNIRDSQKMLRLIQTEGGGGGRGEGDPRTRPAAWSGGGWGILVSVKRGEGTIS